MSNSPKISSSVRPSDGGGPFCSISSLNSWRFFSSTSAMRPSIVLWRDEARDEHRLLLAEPMGAVDRLVLDGRVPPAVEQEHVVGELQVQADAAGAVAHQEDVLRSDRVLKRSRIGLPLLVRHLAVILQRAERRQRLGQRSPAARPTARRRSPCGRSRPPRPCRPATAPAWRSARSAGRSCRSA